MVVGAGVLPASEAFVSDSDLASIPGALQRLLTLPFESPDCVFLFA